MRERERERERVANYLELPNYWCKKLQRNSNFLACSHYFDMSLLIFSRRQRYNKVWKQQNNLKRNIKKCYDKGENLTPLLLLRHLSHVLSLRSRRGKLRERSTKLYALRVCLNRHTLLCYIIILKRKLVISSICDVFHSDVHISGNNLCITLEVLSVAPLQIAFESPYRRQSN